MPQVRDAKTGQYTAGGSGAKMPEGFKQRNWDRLPEVTRAHIANGGSVDGDSTFGYTKEEYDNMEWSDSTYLKENAQQWGVDSYTADTAKNGQVVEREYVFGEASMRAGKPIRGAQGTAEKMAELQSISDKKGIEQKAFKERPTKPSSNPYPKGINGKVEYTDANGKPYKTPLSQELVKFQPDGNFTVKTRRGDKLYKSPKNGEKASGMLAVFEHDLKHYYPRQVQAFKGTAKEQSWVNKYNEMKMLVDHLKGMLG